MDDVEIRSQLLFEGQSKDRYFVSFQGRQFAEVHIVNDNFQLTDLATGRGSGLSSAEELAEMLVSLVRIHLTP